MVYPNAYYNVQHYDQVSMASKHYYMGSQRVASALVHERYPSLGAIETGLGAETDLEETLLCMGLSTSDFKMIVLRRVEDYKDYVSQDDYDALDVSHCQSDPACLCGMDLYWSVGCENHNIMYWYHPDYLEGRAKKIHKMDLARSQPAAWEEFVTDFNGEAYQSFWYNPWGETLRERDSRVGTWEGPWLFHAQHLDQETDNYYMLHRYYDPMKRLGWLSVDPMSAARPWLTPYNFVQNNPVMRTDPTGLLDGDNDTKYEDEDGKLIVETRDGSDDVVTVPKAEEASFRELVEVTPEKMRDSKGWNDNFKAKFLGFETTDDLSTLDHASFQWSRQKLIDYHQGKSYGNWVEFLVAELVGQNINPVNHMPIPIKVRATPKIKSSPKVHVKKPVVQTSTKTSTNAISKNSWIQFNREMGRGKFTKDKYGGSSRRANEARMRAYYTWKASR